MQYAAEVANPTPEGTSNGLIQLSGQVSVVSVYIMEALRTGAGSFTVSMLLLALLLAGCAVLVSRLKDVTFGDQALPEASPPVVAPRPAGATVIVRDSPPDAP